MYQLANSVTEWGAQVACLQPSARRRKSVRPSRPKRSRGWWRDV